MFETLGTLVTSIGFAGQERKVQKYLDEATAESILRDLNEALDSHIRHIGRLRATFQRYYVDGTAQAPYWNAGSFRTYVQSIHATIDDSEIELLWRCFYFYAYHPFPHDTSDAKVGLDAFLRAAALLATHGTRLLGMQDDGSYYWRFDEAFFRRADFQRIFRSFGRSTTSEPTAGFPDRNAMSMVEDAVDVLAMVVPSSVSLAPSPDQLQPTARRLLDARGSFQTQCAVFREDLSTLLRLLLRTRLEKATWGPGLHFGSFDDAKSGDRVLVNSLLSGVLQDSVEEELTIGGLSSVMELLPNIQLRFYQLWSSILQPQSAEDQRRLGELGAVPDRVLRAISLFVPHNIETGVSQTKTSDARFIFEPPTPFSQEGGILPLKRLMDCLASEPRPHLVLGSDFASSSSDTVLGAYFPGPLWLQSSQGSEKYSVKANSSHLLFQVLPRFRILQWTGPHISMADLLNIESDVHGDASVSSADISLAPFTIGTRGFKGTGLHIDPEMLTITLSHRQVSETSNQYEQLRAGNFEHSEQDWAATTQKARLDVFLGSGSMEAEYISRPLAVKEIRSTDFPDRAGSVGSAELAKRIQGFGSTT